jgi:predicted ATPase/class 3 adenylate cyclase/DNA-binding winged helix-turn-helix (wHTH) protein
VSTEQRKLAAILSADVVGYSRLMAQDEAATLRAITAVRVLMRRHIEHRGGRVVDATGDALLADFPSAVEAVRAAVAMQQAQARANAGVAEERRMRLRLGLNLGDVIVQDAALYGDGVNVAARLEALARPGGLCISGSVFDQIEGKLALPFDFAGEQAVKNIARPVRAYHLRGGPAGGHWRLGAAELRADERQLLLHGEPLAVDPDAVELLLLLLEQHERVVDRGEIFDRLHPLGEGGGGGDDELQLLLSQLREHLGPGAVALVPGRGWRYAGPLDNPPAAVAAAPAAAATPAAPRRTNLPESLPPLIGREAELAEVGALVQQHALVTLVGPGGMGKTRLAQAVALAASARWTGGVWMVELGTLSDPALVPGAVAQSVGVKLPGRGDAVEELVGMLRGRAVLLVVDNCEHLLDAVSPLVQALGRDMRILATSQEVLKVPGEQVYRLQALSLPPEDCSVQQALTHGAIDLFVSRARAVSNAFALTPQNLPLVVDVCRQLDGLPLAIELAAARVPLLGVQGVRDRLGERLRMLSTGTRTALRRHQTLRAALDWSHSLLAEPAQRVLRRLAVFAGDFSLTLAQAVAADDELDEWAVLEQLGGLIDKSLLVAEAGDPPSYRLLVSTRTYALERLAESGERRRVQLRLGQALQEQLNADARDYRDGRLGGRVLNARLIGHLDNLRAALDWAAGPDGDANLAVQMASGLEFLVTRIGLGAEAVRRMLAVQHLVGQHTPTELAARFWLCLADISFGGLLPAAQRIEHLGRAEAAFRLLGDQRRLARALANRADLLARVRDFDAAQRALDEALGLEQPAWPAAERAFLALHAGDVLGISGRHAQAVQAFQRCVELSQTAGHELGQQAGLWALAYMAQLMGRLDEAVQRGRDLVALIEASGKGSGYLAGALANLCCALTELGRLDEAQLAAQRALGPLRVSQGIGWAANHLAWMVAAQGWHEDAAVLLGAGDRHEQRSGEPRMPLEQRATERALALIGARFGAEQISAWRQRGAACSDEALERLVAGAQ